MSLFSSIGKMRSPTFEVSSFSLSKNVLFWSRRSLETNTNAKSLQQRQIANNKSNSSLWLRRAKDRAKIYSFTVFAILINSQLSYGHPWVYAQRSKVREKLYDVT